jgi:hypothetical protein
MAKRKKYPHLKELFNTDKNEYFKEWKKLNADKFPVKDKWRVLTTYDKLPDDAREIPGFPSYYARPNGEIWRDTINNSVNVVPGKGKIIKLKDRFNDVCGYHQVQPYVNGKRKVKYVHRLVLAAFKGEPEGTKNEAHHIDADTSNNHINNLMWVTRLENAQYVPTEKRRVLKKTLETGRAISNSKHSHLFPEIIDSVKLGLRPVDISRKFNIGYSSIAQIIKTLRKRGEL